MPQIRHSSLLRGSELGFDDFSRAAEKSEPFVPETGNEHNSDGVSVDRGALIAARWLARRHHLSASVARLIAAELHLGLAP
jgi:hypothetical protein